MISQLTVLGSCGAWPEPGRACSGFLLEHDEFRVAIDLGYGTLPRLLSLLGSPYAAGLDAIVVTHEHPDHMLDLQPLFRARRLGRHRGLPPLPLYAPAGVLDAVARVEQDEIAAKRLLLTHFWPGNDRQRSRADAAEHFPGEILIADEGSVIPLA